MKASVAGHKVTHVCTENKKTGERGRIPCDLIIVGTGIKPSVVCIFLDEKLRIIPAYIF